VGAVLQCGLRADYIGSRPPLIMASAHMPKLAAGMTADVPECAYGKRTHPFEQ
jgi:hypothetical protein